MNEEILIFNKTTCKDNKDMLIDFQFLLAAFDSRGPIPKSYNGYIKRSDDYWECTDGHRVHRVKSWDIGKVGFWKVINRIKTNIIISYDDNIGHWPDIDGLIPRDDDAIRKECKSNVDHLISTTIRMLPEKYQLHYEYIKPLAFFDDINWIIQYTPGISDIAPALPMLYTSFDFQNDGRFAMIMPQQRTE